MLFLSYFVTCFETLLTANLSTAIEYFGEVVEKSFSHFVGEFSSIDDKFVEKV